MTFFFDGSIKVKNLDIIMHAVYMLVCNILCNVHNLTLIVCIFVTFVGMLQNIYISNVFTMLPL